jgi:hypothetical protein
MSFIVFTNNILFNIDTHDSIVFYHSSAEGHSPKSGNAITSIRVDDNNTQVQNTTVTHPLPKVVEHVVFILRLLSCILVALCIVYYIRQNIHEYQRIACISDASCLDEPYTYPLHVLPHNFGLNTIKSSCQNTPTINWNIPERRARGV